MNDSRSALGTIRILAPEEARTTSEHASDPPAILVADDNPVDRLLEIRICQRLGYHADTVANGLDVLHLLENKRYDIILMDVQMPRMDGFDTTRTIRAGRHQPDVVIVGLSYWLLPWDETKCLDAGMNDFVAKPVRPDHLRAVLERWLIHLGRIASTTSAS